MPRANQQEEWPEATLVTGPASAGGRVPNGTVAQTETAGAGGRCEAGHSVTCAREGHLPLRACVREAFGAGDFIAARRWWEAYADGVRRAIEDGTATPVLLNEMRELVEWSRIVVLSFRAHAAERMNQDHAARAYR